MGKHYRHVTERCEIARLRSEGRSVRQIATGLDRSPSTARELKRNMSQSRGYQPVYADQQARARRWRGCRLERDDALRAKVLSGLKQGWSPDQVSGRLKLEAGRTGISHESIYRFVYAQIARRKDYSWRHYLPRAKSKRGWRGRKGGSAGSAAPHCRASAERRRPPHSGSLGSRPDVVQYLWTAHGATPASLAVRGVQPHRPVSCSSSCPNGEGVTFDRVRPRAGHRDLLLRRHGRREASRTLFSDGLCRQDRPGGLGPRISLYG